MRFPNRTGGTGWQGKAMQIEFKRNDVLPVLNKAGAKMVGWTLIDMGRKAGVKAFKSWETALDWDIGLKVMGVFQALQVRYGKVPNCPYRLTIDRNKVTEMELRTKNGEWIALLAK